MRGNLYYSTSIHKQDQIVKGEVMEQDFIDQMKASLLRDREAILSSLNAQTNDMKSLIKAQETGDVVDVASDAIDRQLLSSLSSQNAMRLEQIDGALSRIRQGHYGVCAKCGKDIPQARLVALPYAVMCVKCASK